MTTPTPEPEPQVTVRATIPVEGKDVGDEFAVDAGRANWLISQGYVARVGDHADDVPVTASYKDDENPTLAKNRESGHGNTPGVDTKTVEAKAARPASTGAKQDRSGKASGVKSA